MICLTLQHRIACPEIIYSLIYLFVYSFIYSFICLFIFFFLGGGGKITLHGYSQSDYHLIHHADIYLFVFTT